MKQFYIILLSLCAMLTACATNEADTIAPETVDNVATSDFNTQMNGIALAVNKAICASPEFRGLIKKEAMRKFDDDYDIMLRPLSRMKLSDVSSTRAMGGETTVGNVLNDFFPSATRSTASDIIDSLCALYPLLQISVPVHADEWDSATYTPTVVFVPEDFEENNSETVCGYDAEGNQVTVDAVNEPDVPVIVVGMNERGGENDNVDEGDSPLNMPNRIVVPKPSIPLAPTNLRATLTATSINLQWTASVSPIATGYRIYRKASNESVFSLIGTNNDDLDLTFNDNTWIANLTYQYQVRTLAGTITSLPSNIVTVNAPNVADPVSNLYIYPHNVSQVELRWTYPQIYIDSTVIYRKSIDIVTDYNRIGKIATRSQDYYFDSHIVAGERYAYKVNNYITRHPSASMYDLYCAPYRNINQENPIYVKRMTFDWDRIGDIESWVYGAPEFKVICKLIRANTHEVLSLGTKTYEYESRHSACNFSKSPLCSVPAITTGSSTYDNISFSAFEVDNSTSNINFNATVEFGAKLVVADVVELSVAEVTIPISIKSDDHSMGTANHWYYENPTKTIYYYDNCSFTMNIALSN